MNNNWKYVPFSQLFEWGEKSTIGSRQGKQSGKYRLYIASATEIKYFDEFLADGESLVFGTGGNPCIHYVTGKYSYTNHTESAKCINDKEIFTKFYYYYFQKDRYSQLQTTFAGGGIRNSSKKKIGSLLVPIPDYNEQKKIVSKIEELFSQLDSGVETLKKAKKQLEIYRQAVLKEAFADISKTETIRNMTSIVTSGSRGWAKYYDNSGAIFVRIGNLTRTGIDINLDNIQYVSIPDKAEGVRSLLQPDDILVSITANLGSIGLVPDNIGESYINQHIALVRLKNSFQSKFIAWYLRSDFGQKELLKNKRGAGKLGLGLDDIRDSKVPVVTDNKADKIVSEIESRLSVCDSIEKTIEKSLQEAEVLRQSILKQAFEGVL